jgi:hypothetical protein
VIKKYESYDTNSEFFFWYKKMFDL